MIGPAMLVVRETNGISSKATPKSFLRPLIISAFDAIWWWARIQAKGFLSET